MDDDKKIVSSNDDSMSSLFNSLVSGEYTKVEYDIKIYESKVKKVIQFKQNLSYRFDDSIWPKIYSISLSSDNKQIVTLELRSPTEQNLKSLHNVLHLHSCKYKENIVESGQYIHSIKILENSLNLLAHLTQIYGMISAEATALLWESFRKVVEDYIDKDENFDSWKVSIGFMLDAWADSAIEENCDNEYCNNAQNPYENQSELLNEQAKNKYKKLPDDDKEQFLNSVISYLVKAKAVDIMGNLPIDHNKYSLLENAFNTTDKCNKYIEANLPYLKSNAQQLQDLAVEQFKIILEPSLLELVLDDKNKFIKNGGTGIGSTTSLIAQIGIIAKDHPLVKTITAGVHISKIILSMLHFHKTINQDAQSKKSLDIDELSKMIACKDIICNYQAINQLTDDSKLKLMKFYAKFVYAEISMFSSEQEEEYFASYVLDQVTNYNRIKNLGLEKEYKQILETENGEKIEISDFFSQYNQTICYDGILNVLLGGETVYSDQIMAIS